MESSVGMEAIMSSDWYKDRFSDNDRSNSPCLHRHVVVDTSGGRRFVEGEVTDNILVRVLCLDCMQYLSEAEVRGAWEGDPTKYLIQPIGEDHEYK
jgi:hypothetical protein